MSNLRLSEDITKLIWQSEGTYEGGDFTILLDNEFARQMLKIKLSQQARININKRGKEIRKPWNPSGSGPYWFQDNSALINQLDINTGDGIMLTLTNSSDLKTGKFLVYETHNLIHRNDQLGIITLFDHWVENSDIYGGLK